MCSVASSRSRSLITRATPVVFPDAVRTVHTGDPPSRGRRDRRVVLLGLAHRMRVPLNSDRRRSTTSREPVGRHRREATTGERWRSRRPTPDPARPGEGVPERSRVRRARMIIAAEPDAARSTSHRSCSSTTRAARSEPVVEGGATAASTTRTGSPAAACARCSTRRGTLDGLNQRGPGSGLPEPRAWLRWSGRRRSGRDHLRARQHHRHGPRRRKAAPASSPWPIHGAHFQRRTSSILSVRAPTA